MIIIKQQAAGVSEIHETLHLRDDKGKKLVKKFNFKKNKVEGRKNK